MLKRMFLKIVCAQSDPLEVVTAIQSILWGIWLLLPYDTFGSSRVYSVMATVAPEIWWGTFFLFIGMFQLILVHLRKRNSRRLLALAMLFSWTFADIGFWLSGSSSAAAITYLTFVIAAAWSVIILYKPEQLASRHENRH